MKYTWADFFKEVQKKYPKAKPDKVIKLVANAYGNKTRESNYNMKRSSWSLIVLEAIHLKIGTTKRSTTNISQIIRNWIRTKDFKKFHKLLLGKDPINDEKKLVKRLNDIWVTPKHRHWRMALKEGGQLINLFKIPDKK